MIQCDGCHDAAIAHFEKKFGCLCCAGTPPTRAQLRRQMRQQRRALSERERAAASAELCARFVREPLFRNSRRVAAYLTNDGEMDLQPLIERLWAAGKQVFLPVLYRKQLWFIPYERGSGFVFNRFGIPEPDLAPRERVRLPSLDLALMPLVAFDDAGNRLGMGGGFYDRTFAYLKRASRWRRPLLVGTAFEIQRLPSLPVQPWDMPLEGVLTERGLQHFH